MGNTQDEMDALIETIRSTIGPTSPNRVRKSPRKFREEDGYPGQFHRIYEGCSGHGECHYSMYARFSVAREIDIVRHVTNLNAGRITAPVETITQHIRLSSDDLEELFYGYLEWLATDMEPYVEE